MARIIINKEKGPKEIKCGNKSELMCMCGLSKNKPFCDKSHLKTLDEKEDKVYIYDKKGNRIELN